MLCDDLERGREAQERGDLGIRTADVYNHMILYVETNTTL